MDVMINVKDILNSGETTIDINYKTGKIIYKKIDASQVRTREIINRAIEEVIEDEG